MAFSRLWHAFSECHQCVIHVWTKVHRSGATSMSVALWALARIVPVSALCYWLWLRRPELAIRGPTPVIVIGKKGKSRWSGRGFGVVDVWRIGVCFLGVCTLISRTYILKHDEFVHYINMSLCWLRMLFIGIKFVRYVWSRKYPSCCSCCGSDTAKWRSVDF